MKVKTDQGYMQETGLQPPTPSDPEGTTTFVKWQTPSNTTPPPSGAMSGGHGSSSSSSGNVSMHPRLEKIEPAKGRPGSVIRVTVSDINMDTGYAVKLAFNSLMVDTRTMINGNVLTMVATIPTLQESQAMSLHVPLYLCLLDKSNAVHNTAYITTFTFEMDLSLASPPQTSPTAPILPKEPLSQQQQQHYVDPNASTGTVITSAPYVSHHQPMEPQDLHPFAHDAEMTTMYDPTAPIYPVRDYAAIPQTWPSAYQDRMSFAPLLPNPTQLTNSLQGSMVPLAPMTTGSMAEGVDASMVPPLSIGDSGKTRGGSNATQTRRRSSQATGGKLRTGPHSRTHVYATADKGGATTHVPAVAFKDYHPYPGMDCRVQLHLDDDDVNAVMHHWQPEERRDCRRLVRFQRRIQGHDIHCTIQTILPNMAAHELPPMTGITQVANATNASQPQSSLSMMDDQLHENHQNHQNQHQQPAQAYPQQYDNENQQNTLPMDASDTSATTSVSVSAPMPSMASSSSQVSFYTPSMPSQPPTTVVSCIYWHERGDYYITSVDCIHLLENLLDTRFNVEEKNRVRRNLEGFRPITVSKSRANTAEFFKLIMGFPNPKPRNIEKDVKVFDWRSLPYLLKKIITKYTAIPSLNTDHASSSTGSSTFSEHHPTY